MLVTRTTRLVRRAVIVVVVLTFLVGSAAVLGRYVWGVATCSQPPTQHQRDEQETFVRSHIPDATTFDWHQSDCDDNGQVSLNFTTRLTGSAAVNAFLGDPACTASTGPDASPGDLECQSGDLAVSIYLQDTGAIDTTGQLTWTPD